MRRLIGAVLAAAVASWTETAASQERLKSQRDTSVLERIVITASRREQRLKDVIVETELISRAALERTGAADVATALQDAAGLQIDAGTPAGVGVSLRGFDSRRVLVLLDGQPLVGRLAGHLDLSRIPVQNIERIEIVRGPQSTLYGADALGGVVNIITQRPGARAAAVSMTGGTHGRREASANLSLGREPVALRLDAGRRATSLAPGISADDATYARLWSGSLRAVWRPNESVSMDLSTFGVDEAQRYRTGQLYRFSDNTQLGVRASAEQRRGSSRLTQTLSHSRYGHTARTSTGAQPVSDSGARDVQSLTQLQLGVSTVLPVGVVDAGVDVRDERITADRVRGGSRDAQSLEPFVQLSAQRGVVSVSPGVRMSWHETWGTFIAPRLATAIRLSERVALRAALGSGYRAPDFKEQFISFANPAAGYAVEGNPDLRPERSVSASLGIHAVQNNWSGRVGAFANRFRDFITTTEQDAAGVFHYENIESGTTRGIEAELVLSLGAGSAELGYDYTATRDHRSDAPLPGISPHQARFILTAPPLGGIRATVATHYSAATPLQRIDAGSTLRERGAFSRTDLRFTRTIGPQVRAKAGVTNLFGRELGTEWPGFTGRQIFAGLEWSAVRTPLR